LLNFIIYNYSGTNAYTSEDNTGYTLVTAGNLKIIYIYVFNTFNKKYIY